MAWGIRVVYQTPAPGAEDDEPVILITTSKQGYEISKKLVSIVDFLLLCLLADSSNNL